MRLYSDPEESDQATTQQQFRDAFLVSPRCASVSGFVLHGKVAVHAGDRPRLVRYCARPLIAMERLELYECGSFGRKQLVDD